MERNGVVGLGDRVEELVETDRTAAAVPTGEILALQELRDRDVRGEANQVFEFERAEPGGVEVDPRPGHVEDLAELGAVGLRIRADLVPRERLPRIGSSGRVADHPREVPDDDHHVMAQILKVSKFLEDDRVAQMQIRCSGIQPELDDERTLGRARSLELRTQLRLDDEIGDATADDAQLRVHGGERPGSQRPPCITRLRGAQGDQPADADQPV